MQGGKSFEIVKTPDRFSNSDCQCKGIQSLGPSSPSTLDFGLIGTLAVLTVCTCAFKDSKNGWLFSISVPCPTSLPGVLQVRNGRARRLKKMGFGRRDSEDFEECFFYWLFEVTVTTLYVQVVWGSIRHLTRLIHCNGKGSEEGDQLASGAKRVRVRVQREWAKDINV
jgi:hypothetical protein